MLEEILHRWNKNLNLVSKQDEDAIWERHIVDSLQIIPFFEDVNKLADMGSGPGLPSLPLAIAKPDIDFFAIDMDMSMRDELLCGKDCRSEF